MLYTHMSLSLYIYSIIKPSGSIDWFDNAQYKNHRFKNKEEPGTRNEKNFPFKNVRQSSSRDSKNNIHD